jgi:hypothetical protein
MTGPRQQGDLTAALHRLRGAVRARVTPPPAARLRARAMRQLRVRRTATALAAAAAVAALAVGGFQVVQLTAHQPVPPAETPSPTGAPSPTGSPTPPELPEVTPSPRPAPLAAEPLDDPITQVDWNGRIVIDIPPRDGCPSGPREFTGGSFGGPDGPFPGVLLSVPVGGGQIGAYGDVTGDGRAEALIDAKCFSSPEGIASGHGWQLLAVARSDDGTLTGLGWVGPFNADIQSVWVAGGEVLMVGDPWTAGPEDHFPALPGLALSYRWDGSQFIGWEPAGAYPPIVPLDPAGTGPPVRPRAVATALGCPDVELRFSREEHDWGGTATAAGRTFVIPARHHQQYLFDLDNTGERLLVTALACTDTDGWTREGLAIFERSGDGWQGISVLAPPPGYATAVVGPWDQPEYGILVVHWVVPTPDGGSEEGFSTRYRWTGTVLEPDDARS